MNTVRKRAVRLSGAILAAVCAAAAALPVLSAHAATVEQPLGYRGDLDADGAVSASDIRLLADWLMADDGAVTGERARLADMDENGILNAADLTRLKRTVFGSTEPEMLYTEFEEPLMDAPISFLSPKLPSKGSNRVLMFVIDFPDCTFTQSYSADQVRAISFGASNPDSPSYPLESVTGYYERASYGALTLDADIYSYYTQYGIDTYTGNTDLLVDEVMAAFEWRLDYNRYDNNLDGVLDSLLLSVPDNAPNDGWWPCSGSYAGDRSFDGVKPGNIILGNTSPSDTVQYNNTWIHELGHAMGLPDYYKYENTGNGYFGLNGPAGTEMMDDAYGDMCAFSKLMYGWYTPSQVQVYTGGTQTFSLASSQERGNCILIPHSDLNGYFSEYMLIEYATKAGNNAAEWKLGSGGIRVLHCDAMISEGHWGLEFTWNNYGMYYDTSNERQRVLRLANEKEGGNFFTAGSTVSSSISGFRWYDDSGYQTVDPGVTVTVGALKNGRYTVTVSQ